jgi:hypothetical protein
VTSTFAPYPVAATVLLHESLDDRTWTIRPVHVVASTSHQLAVWMQPGTRYLSPVIPHSVEPARPFPDDWWLRERTWHDGGCISIVEPGAHHMLQGFFGADEQLDYWYVNLQLPITQRGRVLGYLDQELDIVLPPDLSSWSFKDEEAFAALVGAGGIDRTFAEWLREYGKRVAEELVAGNGAVVSRFSTPPDGLRPLTVTEVLAGE